MLHVLLHFGFQYWAIKEQRDIEFSIEPAWAEITVRFKAKLPSCQLPDAPFYLGTANVQRIRKKRPPCRNICAMNYRRSLACPGAFGYCVSTEMLNHELEILIVKLMLIATTISCALLVGCGEKAADAAGAVEQDGDKVTVTTTDRKVNASTGESLKKPDDFPKDVYCGEGPIKAVVKVENGNMITVASTQSTNAIIAEARKMMTEKGWKESMFMNQADAATLTFARNDGTRTCTVHIAAEDGKISVMTTVTTK